MKSNVFLRKVKRGDRIQSANEYDTYVNMMQLQKVQKYIRLHYKRWERRFTLTKRQQIVVITLILVSGLVLTQLVSSELRYPSVIVLSVISYLLSVFVLREDLHGVEWFTLLALPTLFTTAVALFYFLLPVRWLTRLPVAALYAMGIYGLLLTENIYNVAAQRTIALLRAAHTVGFLLTLVTYFILIQTILAFRLPIISNTLLVGIVSFFLSLQALWSMELGERIGKSARSLTLVISFVLMEVMWMFSLIPIRTTLIALFLTTTFYGMVGMGQQYLIARLYKKVVIEFFAVVAIVFAIVMLAIRWRGNV